MTRKLLIGMAATLGLVSAPAFAATEEPVKLSNQQLDEVVAGQSLLGLDLSVNLALQDVTVTADLSNVPVNAAVALQLNALGSAQQVASVTAYQNVTQVSGTSGTG